MRARRRSCSGLSPSSSSLPSRAMSLGSSFLGVLRALASHKLLLLFGAAAVYSGGLVFFGNEVGLWHRSATKTTIYWFFGTAVILVGYATQVSPDDPAFIRRLLRGSLKLTI